MPQLDILIWMNLVFATTICFWGLYYVIIRLFLVNYQLILNLRLKFKNTFFNAVYVILVLLFNYNFQNVKLFLKSQNIAQKKNNIVYYFCTKFINAFYFVISFLKFNMISELFITVHYFFYVLNYNNSSSHV
jgi:hypothetical protein